MKFIINLEKALEVLPSESTFAHTFAGPSMRIGKSNDIKNGPSLCPVVLMRRVSVSGVSPLPETCRDTTAGAPPHAAVVCMEKIDKD